MVSVRFLICIGAAALIGTSAYAADLPQPMYQPPVMVAATSGWYLRGDVGVGVMDFTQFDHSQTNAAFVWPASWQIVQRDIQDTNIFGLGVGYEVNNWLRFDVTGEYRTKAAFKATGSYTNFCTGGGVCFDVNTGNYSAAVFMANAYIDLGTWWCVTPYIGAGVGGAFNLITGVQDNGIISNGTAGFGFASATPGTPTSRGTSRPASPTTSPIVSRWTSATASSAWVRRRRGWWRVKTRRVARAPSTRSKT